MASEQEPPPVPRISTSPPPNAPVPRVASPNGDYVPALGHLTPPRSASPIMPSIRATTSPASLLRTPPMQSQSPSRTWPRRDIQGEYSTARSNPRLTRPTSPSDNLSMTLSPSITSYSSGGRSCSFSSSGYLTPPPFQADCDKRPYRPRRQSSDSLIMARKPKKASTMPHGKLYKSKRRHRRKHTCHHGERRSRRHEHRKNEHWCSQGCQVAPTAPKGMKELCEGRVGRYKPIISIHGNTDTYGRVLPRLWSDPAPPVVTRRWSSVEIGSHRSVSTTPSSQHPDTNEFITGRPSQRYRSSTYTRGAVDNDIVRTVREKLTLRKVPSTHLQTPTIITLRRASGVSTATELINPANYRDTGGTTPLAYTRNQEGQYQADAEYLITRKEIDSITDLIEANLWRNYRPHNHISAHPPITPPSTRRAESPTFTLKGLVPKTAPLVESAVTITQIKPSSPSPQNSLNYLQVASPCTKTNKPSRTPSQKSTYEVIWEANASLNSPSSIRDEVGRKLSSSHSSLQQEMATPTTCQNELKEPQFARTGKDKSDAFDPDNAKASISEWSWRLPQADIPAIVTSSDSDSNDLTPSSEVSPKLNSNVSMRSTASAPEVPRTSARIMARISVKPAGSAPEIPDVVSFPPLPQRQTTSDWHSPLPDISSPEKFTNARSLYDEGIDATGAIDFKAPKPQRPLWLPLTDHPTSPSPGIEFDPDCEVRRKSIKPHPHSPARIGSQSSMGSSIGASSGERRRSLVKPGIHRVRTIDNIHKGERAGTWTRNRPPSVCPPPKTPSPAEFEDEIDAVRSHQMKSGAVDRMRLIHDITPPMPKKDRVGIYGTITGTVRAALGLDACQYECPPHVCDDCSKDPRAPSVDWIG